jgi:hypothetical protein
MYDIIYNNNNNKKQKKKQKPKNHSIHHYQNFTKDNKQFHLPFYLTKNKFEKKYKNVIL